jgi:hypothetical protein
MIQFYVFLSIFPLFPIKIDLLFYNMFLLYHHFYRMATKLYHTNMFYWSEVFREEKTLKEEQLFSCSKKTI